MTQPCHKDTTLNQQCCDREHKEGERGRKRMTDTTSPRPAIHNTHPPTSHCIMPPHTRQKRDENNTKGGTQSEHGDNTHTTRHSTGPQGKRQRGTPTHKTGDANTQRGGQRQYPPFTHHATPPSAMPPHHPRRPHPPPRRGGSTQRIPHHTNTADTPPPPTHHTPGKEQRTT